MNKINEKIDIIINNNKPLIEEAINIMKSIKDKEHNMNHVLDVLDNLALLLEKIPDDFDLEVCIISAYWHDVGRKYTNENHELLSAELLKAKMTELNYDSTIIEKCFKAIKDHHYLAKPQTNEGKILKDADKLAWIGKNRWKECLNSKQKLDNIITVLPKLKDNFLEYEVSKQIYDEKIVDLVTILYNEIYKED